MKKVRYNNFTLSVPDSWNDESMIVWVGPKKGMTAPTICISSAKLPDGESFEKYASDQLEELKNAVGSYVLHEKSETFFKDHQCIKSKISWKADGPRITQIQYTILTEEDLIVAATCTHTTSKFDQSEELFLDMLNNVELL